jgi:hypothetical protein
MAGSPQSTALANDDLFVDVGGNAKALGTHSAASAVTDTFAGAGMAVGFGAFLAAAQGTAVSVPHSITGAYALGGDTHDATTSTHFSNFSIDFPYGQAPVSLSASMVFVGIQSSDLSPTIPGVHDSFSSVGNISHHAVA